MYNSITATLRVNTAKKKQEQKTTLHTLCALKLSHTSSYKVSLDHVIIQHKLFQFETANHDTEDKAATIK